jgi:CheY-like chemotaxis protein
MDALAGLRVLCVDDDADIRDALQALLARWGLSVECAGTAAEALALAEASRPSRLIVDFQLHDAMDGIELAERLLERWGAIPVLLLTAEGGDALRQRARESGFTLVNKPVRPAALRAWLAAG